MATNGVVIGGEVTWEKLVQGKLAHKFWWRDIPLGRETGATLSPSPVPMAEPFPLPGMRQGERRRQGEKAAGVSWPAGAPGRMGQEGENILSRSQSPGLSAKDERPLHSW